MLGESAPDRPSDGYVRLLFESYAERLDESLADLQYSAPQVVSRVLDAQLAGAGAVAAILDAGCGTGLCGPRLRQLAQRLVGVDLSPAMLDKARARRCYDDLVAAELTEFMNRCSEAWDAIVCSDVLVYFGDLVEVARAACRALRPGSRLVFTVERKRAGGSPFRLEVTGRYVHREDYLRRVLMDAGFDVSRLDRGSFRMERGKPVDCLLTVARKPI